MARRRQQGDVELNMAAMLDMAFQLLAFFILTFNPESESEIALRLPPPQMIAGAGTKPRVGTDVNSTELPKGVTTLVVTIVPDDSGDIKGFCIGEANTVPYDPSLAELNRELKKVFMDPANLFEQVIIQVGSNLRYDALMQVIDVCSRQKRKLPDGTEERLSKLSFVEAPSGPEG